MITVPPYYNQMERKALLYAANLAGLKVSQLMDDNTAGLSYFAQFAQKNVPENNVWSLSVVFQREFAFCISLIVWFLSVFISGRML